MSQVYINKRYIQRYQKKVKFAADVSMFISFCEKRGVGSRMKGPPNSNVMRQGTMMPRDAKRYLHGSVSRHLLVELREFLFGNRSSKAPTFADVVDNVILLHVTQVHVWRRLAKVEIFRQSQSPAFTTAHPWAMQELEPDTRTSVGQHRRPVGRVRVRRI